MVGSKGFRNNPTKPPQAVKGRPLPTIQASKRPLLYSPATQAVKKTPAYQAKIP